MLQGGVCVLKKLKIGIIGAGRIGRLHGDNIVGRVPNAKLAAIADPMMNGEMMEWAARLGVTKCFHNPEEIMHDPGIDAVFICSSTSTHADLIIQAAGAGKHIMCEKPIHTDINMIRKALAAAENAGVKLMVGLVRRFDHNHKKVRDTVNSGKLGRPHMVKITSRDPEMPPAEYLRTSGGLFLDMTIHDFDMARYLAGSEVTEVMAYGSVMIDEDIKEFGDIDTAAIMLKFQNGAIGVIDNSRAAHYGYDQRTEVHCDKGCVQVANDLYDTSMISTADGVLIEKPTWFFLERYNNAFIAEANAFVEAVLNDKAVPVDGTDGLMSVLIAKAADLSIIENRPIRITEMN